MRIIYLVIKEQGDHDAYEMEPLKAFDNREDAEKFKVHLQNLTGSVMNKIRHIDEKQNLEAAQIMEAAGWFSDEAEEKTRNLWVKYDALRANVYSSIEDKWERELMQRTFDFPYFSIQELELW